MVARILVTGGAGFLGANLCRRLLQDGHAVIALDNLYTGQARNIAQLEALPNFSWINADVRDPCELAVDAIYHLACPASPPHYQRDPVFTTTTCVVGTQRMLELAARLQIPLVFSSTSEVYGDPLEHPQRESYRGAVNPIGPRACYDEGKRCAESLCADVARQTGAAIKVARIFNTYGPLMDPADGRVVSQFITQAVRGEPLTLYGSGRQTRSLCYVDDLVEGLVRLMASRYTILDGPVNLGNPDEHTVRALAEQIQQLCGTHMPITAHPLPIDDPQQRCPDITRAREWLDWHPTVSLRDGLVRTIQYFRTSHFR